MSNRFDVNKPRKTLQAAMAKSLVGLVVWVFVATWFLYASMSPSQIESRGGQVQLSTVQSQFQALEREVLLLWGQIQGDILRANVDPAFSSFDYEDQIVYIEQLKGSAEQELARWKALTGSGESIPEWKYKLQDIRDWLPSASMPELSPELESNLKEELQNLKQVSGVLLLQMRAVARNQALNQTTLQYFLLAFGGITVLMIVWVIVNFRQRLKQGLMSVDSMVHHLMNWQLDFSPHWERNDEFRDQIFALTQLKEASLYTAREVEEEHNMLSSAFQQSSVPALLLNEERNVIQINQAFSNIWADNTERLALILGLERYDEIIGEQIPVSDELGAENGEPVRVRIGQSVFLQSEVHLLQNGKLVGYWWRLEPASEAIELAVLASTVTLMSNDCWDAPIRIQRGDSPAKKLVEGLEQIRLRVTNTLHEITLLAGAAVDSPLKKLEQIPAVFGQSKRSEDVPLPLIPSPAVPDLEEIQHCLDEVCELLVTETSVTTLPESTSSGTDILPDELENSLMLGYESLCQRIDLVRKDVKNSVYGLSQSVNCLNEVRAATLNALLSEDSKGDVISALARDINHDIDTVISVLDDLLRDERATLEMLTADLDVANKRAQKASSVIEKLRHAQPPLTAATMYEHDVRTIEQSLELLAYVKRRLEGQNFGKTSESVELPDDMQENWDQF